MTIKLGLVGTGTVGGGCIDILQKHKEDFKRHYGIDVELARVCSRDPEQAEAHGVSDLFTLDYHDIVNDPDIDIVIELIGGTTVARDVVVSALEAGKNVVTANKALMATHGEEVMHLAEKMNREIAFEASVGGGIPIIDPLKHSLISNEITSVMGIVNGTTNYMLTRMVDDNLSYDQALKEAQERGFAEADPTADVDGFDAAAKIAILASIAFNSRVTLDDVHTEGIRNITTLDLDTADDMGYVIKLLAIAHRTPDGIDVRVHPTMLPKAHQLATVNGRRGRDDVLRRGRGRGPGGERRHGRRARGGAPSHAGRFPHRGLHLHRQPAHPSGGGSADEVLYPLRRGRSLRCARCDGGRVRQTRRLRALCGAARQLRARDGEPLLRHAHCQGSERARGARGNRRA